MPTYVALVNWTEQGIANFKDSVDRYEANQPEFEKLGVRVRDIYWTVGDHDMVSLIDAPDDETVAAALLMLGSQGNLRTTTMRAFSRDEMRAVIDKTS